MPNRLIQADDVSLYKDVSKENSPVADSNNMATYLQKEKLKEKKLSGSIQNNDLTVLDIQSVFMVNKRMTQQINIPNQRQSLKQELIKGVLGKIESSGRSSNGYIKESIHYKSHESIDKVSKEHSNVSFNPDGSNEKGQEIKLGTNEHRTE